MRSEAGIDTVDGGERAAEHVIQAAVLGRALYGKQVNGLLDDANDRAVAPRVEADAAHVFLGEVAALAAKPHFFLHVLDRLRERESLVLVRTQQVEGEPLSRARAHAGQARQLRDEVVDGRAEHGPIVQVLAGEPLPVGRDRRAPVGRPRGADGEVADRVRLHCAVHVEDAGGHDDDAVRLDRLPLVTGDPDEAGSPDEAEHLVGGMGVRPRVSARIEVDREVVELGRATVPRLRSSACARGP